MVPLTALAQINETSVESTEPSTSISREGSDRAYLLTYAHRSRWSIGHQRPLSIALCSGLLWSFRTSMSLAVSALLQWRWAWLGFILRKPSPRDPSIQPFCLAPPEWEPSDLLFVVGWLLNIPATGKCISGTDLLRQFYVLSHWDKLQTKISISPSHSILTPANQSQHWPYNTRRLAG